MDYDLEKCLEQVTKKYDDTCCTQNVIFLDELVGIKRENSGCC